MTSRPRNRDFDGSAPPKVWTGHFLQSNTSVYSVLEFIGEGCFGKVARCKNLATKEMVAVKIIKGTVQHKETKELSILQRISFLNPDCTNIVKFYEPFHHMGRFCLAFEMLNRGLNDLLLEQQGVPLSLAEIRLIAKQLLMALDTLALVGVVHTDIKPDNVMLVSRQDLRIKLIDFGEALLAYKAHPGMLLQPIGYRAPEIALGLPFTHAIDVWGVGCILAYLYIDGHLFDVLCPYQMMKCMVEVRGQPKEHLLRAGKYTNLFFSPVEAPEGPTWRLKTPEEYSAASNRMPAKDHCLTTLIRSLEDLTLFYPQGGAPEFMDRCAFVGLLNQLLHLDGDQRISAHRALQHPFVTMAHLTAPYSRDYRGSSKNMMFTIGLSRRGERPGLSTFSPS